VCLCGLNLSEKFFHFAHVSYVLDMFQCVPCCCSAVHMTHTVVICYRLGTLGCSRGPAGPHKALCCKVCRALGRHVLLCQVSFDGLLPLFHTFGQESCRVISVTLLSVLLCMLRMSAMLALGYKARKLKLRAADGWPQHTGHCTRLYDRLCLSEAWPNASEVLGM
jgi:hypothetical protein